MAALNLFSLPDAIMLYFSSLESTILMSLLSTSFLGLIADTSMVLASSPSLELACCVLLLLS
jgi:hypothetical protein